MCYNISNDNNFFCIKTYLHNLFLYIFSSSSGWLTVGVKVEDKILYCILYYWVNKSNLNINAGLEKYQNKYPHLLLTEMSLLLN